ncbi:MAG: hypothetical protein CVU55_04335 [Deltaproteobacteria bacterium HGW-Deltaproteobacteria-13]|jgi:hypothetical protein|nr:MAG: hypothetical protein CVU55_04335 [Deltaproteobacteria bacterium HGW-Deltaproteobacteria-13]
MSKAGQNTQKGIGAQNWAAMSLFLQFLKRPGFSYIQLEPDDSEDFDLVFSDGKRIICESKYRKETFGYTQLRELLKTIMERKQIGEQDEILVVCKSANKDLLSNIKNIKWFKELKKKFEEKSFDTESIELLPKVKFWILSKGLDDGINYSLVAELLDMWLPFEDIKKFTDSTIYQSIYKSSTQGGVYRREDFEREVTNFKDEVQKRSDYFNNEKKTKDKQLEKLEKDININKGIDWGSGSISTFSLRWDLMSFATDRLKSKTDLDLEKWKDLWQLNRVYFFAFNIFRIFENNLQSIENKRYALQYANLYVKEPRGFYRSDFYVTTVISLVMKIIKDTDGTLFVNDALEIMKHLLSFNKDELFYLKNDRDGDEKWERGEVCKVLQRIYEMGDKNIKQKIFDLITKIFNLTEDSGRHNIYSPMEAYQIVEQWISDDFLARFQKTVDVIASQYERYFAKYGKKITYKGWELSGSTTSYMGGTYETSDRHLVSYIFEPAIRKFYDSDPEQGWSFVKSRCISRTKEVTQQRPDFLNRSVYKIILKRYGNADKANSTEAFSILKEFINAKRGIPHKSELIFETAREFGLSSNKRWKLAELPTRKYKSPISPFQEQIVSDLANEGHMKAKELLKVWYVNTKYTRGRSIFGGDPIASIYAQLESDIDFAVELFRILLSQDWLKSKGDEFHAYDVARLLRQILKRDYEKGLSILRLLESYETLNRHGQVIYTHSLYDSRGNDDSDDPILLGRLYDDVVNPFLNGAGNDISRICCRISFANCREAFVQFAGRLITKKRIPEALKIIRVFINDPDPYLPGKDPDDPEGKYNEHKKIEAGEELSSLTSVRGWCGWMLMKCAVVEGRDQISEVIQLSEKLLLDENYYVVHMGCFALSQLARNRLTVLPDNKEVLFLNNDKEKALRMSKNIENLAFGLIDRFITWPELVRKAMAKNILFTFGHIRALSEADALKLVTFLSKQTPEFIREAAPIFIYFAEFRKENFRNWKFFSPGLYDDLGAAKYDAGKFRKILVDTIERLQKEDKKACFGFAASFEHIIRDECGSNTKGRALTKMVLGYFNLLTNAYDHGLFHLIYETILKKMDSDDEDFDSWYSLYFKCIEIEKAFYYETNFVPGTTTKMSWWPYYYTSKILERIYIRGGKEKFIRAAQVVFSFPVEVRIEESETVVSILETLTKEDDDKRAKEILKRLFEKNPSKYWDMMKSFSVK